MVNRVIARAPAALKREEGQAMAEYAVILALVAAIVIAVLITLGGQIQSAFQSVANSL